MAAKTFSIRGKVISRKTGRGISSLLVHVWDKDPHHDDLLGSAPTNRLGFFQIEYTLEDAHEFKPDLYFKIEYKGKEIHSTRDHIRYDLDPGKTLAPIIIDWPPGKKEEKFTVTGTVKTTENLAVPGLAVEAFDQKIGRTTFLGKGKTDEAGYYLIDYTKKGRELLGNEAADLFVQVKKGRKILAKSELLVNAPREALINLTVPETVFRGPSEYDKLEKAIYGLIEAGEIAQLKDEDVEYLIAKLKLERIKVNRFLHAHKLVLAAGEYGTDFCIPPEIFYGIISDDALPGLEDLVSQSVEGLKQSLQKAVASKIIPLFKAEEIDKYVAILKEIAVEIAGRDPDDPDAYTTKRLVENVYDLPGDLQKTFVRRFTLHQGPRETFLKELLEEEPAFDAHIEQITGLFTLSDLTQKNVSLITVLNRDITDSERGYSKGVRDLAKKDVDGEDGWADYLHKNDIKIPNKDHDGKPSTIKAYARGLAAAFKKEFPMVDFVHFLDQGKKLPEDEAVKERFLRFFDDNPGFHLEQISIDHYLAVSGIEEKFEKERDDAQDDQEKEKIEKQQEAFKAEVRSWQRVYKLLPDDEKRKERTVAIREIEIEERKLELPQKANAGKISKGKSTPVKKTKIDSAVKIASMHKEDFIHQWQKVRNKNRRFNKEELRREGEDIYNRARFVSFALAASAWNVAAPLDNVRPAVIPPSVIPFPPQKNGNDNSDAAQRAAFYFRGMETLLPQYSNRAIANLSTLFGNQNYCECEHCQSVLSPAAYLCELLLPPGGLDFQALNSLALSHILNIRRIDIFLLKLNCKNTHTELPYIDIVNELLERWMFLLHREAITLNDLNWVYENYNLQSTLESKELALRPENEYKEAYIELAKALYPFSVPWDKWFEEARLYLDYMNLPLHQLIEVFMPTPLGQVFPRNRFDHHARRRNQLNSDEIIRAFLGLSKSAYKLIIGHFSPALVADLQQYFGVDSLSEAKKLPVLMHQLGFWKGNKKGDFGSEDFILMRQIFSTKYIQDSRPSPSLSINIHFGNTACDYNEAELENITEDTFVRLTKFEHLRRSLGWTPFELHNAIMVFEKVHLSNTGRRLRTDILKSKFLGQISHVVRLANRKRNVSVTELLSWWGPIETGAGLSKFTPVFEKEQENEKRKTLYEKVFLDKSLFSTDDDSEQKYFLLNIKQ